MLCNFRLNWFVLTVNIHDVDHFLSIIYIFVVSYELLMKVWHKTCTHMYKLSKDYTQYLSVVSTCLEVWLYTISKSKTALELNQPFLNVCMKETMDNMVFFFSNLMCIVIKITEIFYISTISGLQDCIYKKKFVFQIYLKNIQNWYVKPLLNILIYSKSPIATDRVLNKKVSIWMVLRLKNFHSL